jgi:hypothetical protein
MKIYLAHRYSGTEEEMEERFQNANRVAGILMEEGHVVFSPVSHSHPISKTMKNELDVDFWLHQDFPMIEWSNAVWIVNAFNWWESNGIRKEIIFAQEINRALKVIRR